MWTPTNQVCDRLNQLIDGSGGGVLPYQNGGGVPPEPHGAYGEIKKFMVTNRELLNNLSNSYKRKVSPGGTFSLGNFLFGERENYQI